MKKWNIKSLCFFDIWVRVAVLVGMKLSEQTDSLTEASNLADDSYDRGEIQNEQQYRNALDRFYKRAMKLLFGYNQTNVFSILGSIVETSEKTMGFQISFVHDDCMRSFRIWSRCNTWKIQFFI